MPGAGSGHLAGGDASAGRLIRYLNTPPRRWRGRDPVSLVFLSILVWSRCRRGRRRRPIRDSRRP